MEVCLWCGHIKDAHRYTPERGGWFCACMSGIRTHGYCSTDWEPKRRDIYGRVVFSSSEVNDALIGDMANE